MAVLLLSICPQMPVFLLVSLETPNGVLIYSYIYYKPQHNRLFTVINIMIKCPLKIRLNWTIGCLSDHLSITFLLIAFLWFMHRKTSDVPEYHREEGEMVIPSYGYFIRGAQTTFNGVLRFVNTSSSFPFGAGGFVSNAFMS